jgi:hypothetical protein
MDHLVRDSVITDTKRFPFAPSWGEGQDEGWLNNCTRSLPIKRRLLQIEGVSR